MPVLAAIDLKTNDLETLIAAKNELMDPVAESLFAENGHRWQVVARTDEGVRLLNLWESEEGRDRANSDPRLIDAREAVLAHTGAQASYSSYPVLALKATAGEESANLAIYRRVVEEAFSRGNTDVLDELISPEFIENEAGPDQGRGREGLKDVVRRLRTAFPDLAVTIDDSFAIADRSCARITFSGTHDGEFLGIPPTARNLSWGAIDICRFADGRLAEHWGQVDRLALLQQLGAVHTSA